MRGKPGTTVKFQVKKLRGGPSWKAGDVIEVDGSPVTVAALSEQSVNRIQYSSIEV